MSAMSTARTLMIVLLGVAMGAITQAPDATARPRTQLPVTYDFATGLRAELAHPGGSLRGTNDFSCRPTARHPRPVLLLHGSGGGRQTNWGTLAPVLANAGYCVFAPTYGALGGAWPVSALGGMGVKTDSAWEVKQFADRVLAATGARQLDIVGHSMGTEVPTYWMKYLGGRHRVAHYVSLAPYWRQAADEDDVRSDLVAAVKRGLGIAPLMPTPLTSSTCPGCRKPPEVNFNRAVREPTPYLSGVRYTNITTSGDRNVTPYTAGLLPGPRGSDVTNIVVQRGCPQDRSDHISIVANPRSAAMVLNALDPGHRRPVPCVPVKPFVG